MKLKKLLIIIGVVSFLLVLVVIKNSCQKIKFVKTSREAPETALVNSSMNVFASKITIYNGSDDKNKIILSKNVEGEWVLESRLGLKVRKEAVDSILNTLNNLKGEKRAEAKAVFSDFQIQDNESAHLILAGADGKALTHLVISFKKLNGNQNFIREFNSEKVMLANRDILNVIGLPERTAKCDGNFFADYRIFSFDINSVNKIELTGSRIRPSVLAKTDSLWNFEPADKKSSPDLPKVNEYLQNISTFYAQDILDPALKDYGFKRPYKVLKLSLLKGGKPEEIRMDVGNYIKEKHSYYVLVMPQNQAFILSDKFINSLNRDKSYFSVKTNKK